MDTVQLNNSYSLTGKKLIVVGSLPIFPLESNADLLLLTQSTKINLERLIDFKNNPEQYLRMATATPVSSKNGKAPASKKEIPFHYTGEKGYYMFEF